MTTGTIEKAAPAVFMLQAAKYPQPVGEQIEKLRKWERQRGQEIGFKFSMMYPEGTMTITDSADGTWNDCAYDR